MLMDSVDLYQSLPRATSQKRNKEPKLINLTVQWEKVLFGVPQGLILGRIFFNIFLSDLFLTVKDVSIASYADDNTTYKSVTMEMMV